MAYGHNFWWGADYESRGRDLKGPAAAFAELNYRGMENILAGCGC
jgi:hypothetical protein